jgi:hypothetical protein
MRRIRLAIVAGFMLASLWPCAGRFGGSMSKHVELEFLHG